MQTPISQLIISFSDDPLSLEGKLKLRFFQNHLCMGLYGGLNAKTIHTKIRIEEKSADIVSRGKFRTRSKTIQYNTNRRK